jgi:hypothetical protein
MRLRLIGGGSGRNWPGSGLPSNTRFLSCSSLHARAHWARMWGATSRFWTSPKRVDCMATSCARSLDLPRRGSGLSEAVTTAAGDCTFIVEEDARIPLSGLVKQRWTRTGLPPSPASAVAPCIWGSASKATTVTSTAILYMAVTV